MTDESGRTGSSEHARHVLRIVARTLARGRGADDPTAGHAPPHSAHGRRVLRGIVDGGAVRLRYDDARAEAGGTGAPHLVSDALDALLQVRCEALAQREFPGAVSNIAAALDARCEQELAATLPTRRAGDLPLALSLVAREVIAGAALRPAASRLVTPWRADLQEIDGALQSCAACVEDQEAFTRAAERLLRILGLAAIPPSDAEQPRPALSPRMARTGRVDVSTSGLAREAALGTPGGDPAVAEADAYRVFTTEFDEIVDADALCAPDELAALWRSLQAEMLPYEQLIGRLAGRLERRLRARHYRSADRDQDEGLLDDTRLARIVATPTRPLAFKREMTSRRMDTVVTLLIDNSASMRGRAITIAAATAGVIARALERCGVKVEILGYTTREWHGGLARQRWIDRGRPDSPGRLNDLRHIIYKRADVPWRRARTNLAVMFKPGLLKENVDGEAVLWAHARLTRRPEERRILVVVCDGAPVDDATLSANPRDYLSAHLRATTRSISRQGRVELIGIGIRRDVSTFYPRALRLGDVSALGESAVAELAALLVTTDR